MKACNAIFLLGAAALGLAAGKKPAPGPANLTFALDAGFGDNMVLQQAPAQAAVYGFLDATGRAVNVTLLDSNGNILAVAAAAINSTHQAFGPDWGVRPCPKDACPPYDMESFNPFGVPIPTWKALLPPMPAGGDYTVVVTCAGCEAPSLTISNVTFGAVWYCSGQSNMWLPVLHTFSRNDTARNISAGHYTNIRLAAGNSGSVPYAKWPPSYAGAGGSNPWMTAAQAAPEGCVDDQSCPFFLIGGTCWYFAQGLAEGGVTVPIGIIDTAIGGQRIEEFMNNHTIGVCSEREGENIPWWDAELFGQQVLPFVDMTLEGWVWYQGENNMGGTKGNSIANIGYGCMQRELVRGWRSIWSETPGTTDPLAPFGIVTLASSGSEGGPNMGAMRWAQTANAGVLPSAEMPNTFFAQAYDLDDPWGPNGGPCFAPEWACCEPKYNATTCAGRESVCALACQASSGSSIVMGGIHPRDKKPVGDRLARAALNSYYGGSAAYTGPTLSGCSSKGNTLTVQFNTTLLRNDVLSLQPIPAYLPPTRDQPQGTGGSQLWVQTNASIFCMEAQCVTNQTTGECLRNGGEICPTWAGGDGTTVYASGELDSGWVQLNFTMAASGTAIDVDLTPLAGAAPTAVRYAWGIIDCCDHTDPTLYVTHGCLAACPVMSSSGLPANPFQAQIVDGSCTCVAPQVCGSA